MKGGRRECEEGNGGIMQNWLPAGTIAPCTWGGLVQHDILLNSPFNQTCKKLTNFPEWNFSFPQKSV